MGLCAQRQTRGFLCMGVCVCIRERESERERERVDSAGKEEKKNIEGNLSSILSVFYVENDLDLRQ